MCVCVRVCVCACVCVCILSMSLSGVSLIESDSIKIKSLLNYQTNSSNNVRVTPKNS